MQGRRLRRKRLQSITCQFSVHSKHMGSHIHVADVVIIATRSRYFHNHIEILLSLLSALSLSSEYYEKVFYFIIFFRTRRGECIHRVQASQKKQKKNAKKLGRSHTFTYFTNTSRVRSQYQAVYTPYPKIISCTSQLEVKNFFQPNVNHVDLKKGINFYFVIVFFASLFRVFRRVLFSLSTAFFFFVFTQSCIMSFLLALRM